MLSSYRDRDVDIHIHIHVTFDNRRGAPRLESNSVLCIMNHDDGVKMFAN